MMLCAVLVLSMMALAACGSKGNDSGAAKDDANTEADANADDTNAPEEGADDAQEPEAGADANADDSAANDGRYASIEEYVNSDEVQSQMDSLKSISEAQGMAIEITGEGNKLVYTYTYQSITAADVEGKGAAELLESEMAEQASTFTDLAGQLKLVVAVDDPVVVVRYLGSDGGEIYTQEFAAE